MDSTWKGSCFYLITAAILSRRFRRLNHSDRGHTQTLLSAIPARVVLFPFGVMHLREKLYFTIALCSHRQASTVHTGKSECEGSTYARCRI